MCWDACKVLASYRLRTNCYRLPSRRRTRRLRRCRPRDVLAASAPARLFAKTAWPRSRSLTHVIAAPDAEPRLETCCAPSARSRVRLRRWPKRSTGAWHVPFTRIRYGGVLSGADAVVFVPATAAAFRRRGFDHMEAIARPFCELSGVPLLDALVKYGHGDQRELGREERRERARGMYETVEDVRGRRLLLIDDVITTGATMAAASAELKRAGAATVDGLAIARVW